MTSGLELEVKGIAANLKQLYEPNSPSNFKLKIYSF